MAKLSFKNVTNSLQASQGVYDQINQNFQGQNEKIKVTQEAREILGEASNNLSDQEVYELVTEMQFLVENWLEEYEKNVFDGKTLNELLKLE